MKRMDAVHHYYSLQTIYTILHIGICNLNILKCVTRYICTYIDIHIQGSEGLRQGGTLYFFIHSRMYMFSEKFRKLKSKIREIRNLSLYTIYDKAFPIGAQIMQNKSMLVSLIISSSNKNQVQYLKYFFFIVIIIYYFYHNKNDMQDVVHNLQSLFVISSMFPNNGKAGGPFNFKHSTTAFT